MLVDRIRDARPSVEIVVERQTRRLNQNHKPPRLGIHLQKELNASPLISPFSSRATPRYSTRYRLMFTFFLGLVDSTTQLSLIARLISTHPRYDA